ncbi:hypothetical protein HDV05_006102 [Chytridiales sp. JEL 0842]|nr:hypothetical protein HDV05_006102 [Chytridiales sp. JEL 0842]
MASAYGYSSARGSPYLPDSSPYGYPPTHDGGMRQPHPHSVPPPFSRSHPYGSYPQRGQHGFPRPPPPPAAAGYYESMMGSGPYRRSSVDGSLSGPPPGGYPPQPHMMGGNYTPQQLQEMQQQLARPSSSMDSMGTTPPPPPPAASSVSDPRSVLRPRGRPPKSFVGATALPKPVYPITSPYAHRTPKPTTDPLSSSTEPQPTTTTTTQTPADISKLVRTPSTTSSSSTTTSNPVASVIASTTTRFKKMETLQIKCLRCEGTIGRLLVHGWSKATQALALYACMSCEGCDERGGVGLEGLEGGEVGAGKKRGREEGEEVVEVEVEEKEEGTGMDSKMVDAGRAATLRGDAVDDMGGRSAKRARMASPEGGFDPTHVTPTVVRRGPEAHLLKQPRTVRLRRIWFGGDVVANAVEMVPCLLCKKIKGFGCVVGEEEPKEGSNVGGEEGEVTVNTRDFNPGDDKAGQCWNGRWGDLGIEMICEGCYLKYGGRFRTGKWRPQEMFPYGRKTCSLSHIRIGVSKTPSIAVWSCPDDIAQEELQDILDECKDVYSDCFYSTAAVPEVMESLEELSTFDNLHRYLSNRFLTVQHLARTLVELQSPWAPPHQQHQAHHQSPYAPQLASAYDPYYGSAPHPSYPPYGMYPPHPPTMHSSTLPPPPPPPFFDNHGGRLYIAILSIQELAKKKSVEPKESDMAFLYPGTYWTSSSSSSSSSSGRNDAANANGGSLDVVEAGGMAASSSGSIGGYPSKFVQTPSPHQQPHQVHGVIDALMDRVGLGLDGQQQVPIVESKPPSSAKEPTYRRMTAGYVVAYYTPHNGLTALLDFVLRVPTMQQGTLEGDLLSALLRRIELDEAHRRSRGLGGGQAAQQMMIYPMKHPDKWKGPRQFCMVMEKALVKWRTHIGKFGFVEHKHAQPVALASSNAAGEDLVGSQKSLREGERDGGEEDDTLIENDEEMEGSSGVRRPRDSSQPQSEGGPNETPTPFGYDNNTTHHRSNRSGSAGSSLQLSTTSLPPRRQSSTPTLNTPPTAEMPPITPTTPGQDPLIPFESSELSVLVSSRTGGVCMGATAKEVRSYQATKRVSLKWTFTR